MRHLAIVTFVFAFWVQMPLALQAVDQAKAEPPVGDRLKHVQRLSKIERDRLERNIQTFEGLGDDKKEHYRRLHEELVKDQKQGGTLSIILDAYTQWLHTLSPVQREQLRSESESGRKIALIRQFMEEHERQAKEEHDRLMKDEQNNVRGTTALPIAPATPDPRKGTNRRAIELTRNDLDAVMKVLLDDIPPDKRTADIESLPVDQYWKIVVESAKLKQDFTQWPDDALSKKILAKLRVPSVIWIVTSSNREESDRVIMVRLLLGGIVRQAREQVKKATDEQLRSTYEKLSNSDRDKVDAFDSPERKRIWLNERYLQQNGDESQKKFRECRKAVLELFAQLEVDPPPQLLPPPGSKR